jgi:hypothetical protein
VIPARANSHLTVLPAVRVVYVWRTAGADHLAGRYARERKLDIYVVADRCPDILDKVSPNAVVVFDGGGKESAELVRAAREQKVAVQLIDVRRFVLPARSLQACPPPASDHSSESSPCLEGVTRREDLDF